jgi:hypothetical protein
MHTQYLKLCRLSAIYNSHGLAQPIFLTCKKVKIAYLCITKNHILLPQCILQKKNLQNLRGFWA